jgi:hypothetical protein
MALKRRLQEQDIAQELILDSDSDKQLYEDDISPSISTTDIDSDNESDGLYAVG